MTENLSSRRSEHLFRVDKFVVPSHDRDEFLAKVRKTREHLKTLPGFLRDIVLEHSSGPGEFNFVTVVEWDNAASVENAKATVMAMHKATNFNPREQSTTRDKEIIKNIRYARHDASNIL
jgi:heme-degrading monooxygenase HmoA